MSGMGMPTVAVMMPADMGSAVAALLRRHGVRVVTNLAGRSERTRGLAIAAGVEDLGDDRRLVATAELVLSIVVPSAACALAERLAEAIRAEGRPVVYADLNAVAPSTVRAVARVIEEAGGRVVDGGIIGHPPREDSTRTRIYASGPAVAEFAKLAAAGLDVRPIGAEVGTASALKMCYAALTKGSAALMTQLLVAAARLGVAAPLHEELGQSQKEQLARMAQLVPASVPKAFRWVAEMEEIARTFETAGLSGETFAGAAWIFDAVARTELGSMSVEEWEKAALPCAEVVARLAAAIER
jgi:3-hydroxyisobutyrate dehydrogenase-like beta-hydroxyacid dehydrogenase